MFLYLKCKAYLTTCQDASSERFFFFTCCPKYVTFVLVLLCDSDDARLQLHSAHFLVGAAAHDRPFYTESLCQSSHFQ